MRRGHAIARRLPGSDTAHDVNDRSSVKILGNSDPPSRLKLSIGW
jgi:hypothetical protein